MRPCCRPWSRARVCSSSIALFATGIHTPISLHVRVTLFCLPPALFGLCTRSLWAGRWITRLVTARESDVPSLVIIFASPDCILPLTVVCERESLVYVFVCVCDMVCLLIIPRLPQHSLRVNINIDRQSLFMYLIGVSFCNFLRHTDRQTNTDV